MLLFSLEKNKSYGCRTRSIVVLLEQGIFEDGVSEIKPIQVKLISAIKEKQICLISTPVWQIFLEKLNELRILGNVNGTAECSALSYLTALEERLVELSKMLNTDSCDDMLHHRSMVVDCINNEFFSPEAADKLRKNNMLLHNDMCSYIQKLLPYYLTYFNASEWSVYKINKDFRLLVPQEVLTALPTEQLGNGDIEYITEKERILGLKVDHLDKDLILDSCLTSELLGDYEREPGTFINTLRSIFVTKNDTEQETSSWIIYLSGHGYNSPGAVKTKCDIIADLSVEEFKNFLQFLEHDIITKFLMYSTCYAGGMHLKTPYTTGDVADCYSYTIVTDCISDVASITTWCFPVIFDKNGLLCVDSIMWDEQQGIPQLRFRSSAHFGAFFEKIISVRDAAELREVIISDIAPHMLCNIPWVRFAGKKNFVLLYPYNTYQTIDTKLVMLKKVSGGSIDISEKKVALINTPYIYVPVIMNKSRIDSTIVGLLSVMGGRAVHVFEKLDASCIHVEDIISSFWPFGDQTFDVLFLFKELVLANDPESPLAKAINATEEKVILRNVILIQKSKPLVRMVFETKDGKVFCSYARKVEDCKEPSIRSFILLDEKAAEKYLAQFNTLEKQAIDDEQKLQEQFTELKDKLKILVDDKEKRDTEQQHVAV